MFDKFAQLPIAKQESILNAALAVFAEKGYAQASTNEMVKRAGISKGLLFHYFGNKESLFLYLLDHCIALMQQKLPPVSSLKGKDMLTSIREQALLKLAIIEKHPHLFSFYQAAFGETEPALRQKVLEKQLQFTQPLYQELYQLFDFSGFKPGLDPQKTYTVVMSTLEKVGLEAMRHQGCSMQEVVAIINDYIAYFQKLFYREDHHA